MFRWGTSSSRLHALVPSFLPRVALQLRRAGRRQADPQDTPAPGLRGSPGGRERGNPLCVFADLAVHVCGVAVAERGGHLLRRLPE